MPYPGTTLPKIVKATLRLLGLLAQKAGVVPENVEVTTTPITKSRGFAGVRFSWEALLGERQTTKMKAHRYHEILVELASKAGIAGGRKADIVALRNDAGSGEAKEHGYIHLRLVWKPGSENEVFWVPIHLPHGSNELVVDVDGPYHHPQQGFRPPSLSEEEVKERLDADD